MRSSATRASTGRSTSALAEQATNPDAARRLWEQHRQADRRPGALGAARQPERRRRPLQARRQLPVQPARRDADRPALGALIARVPTYSVRSVASRQLEAGDSDVPRPGVGRRSRDRTSEVHAAARAAFSGICVTRAASSFSCAPARCSSTRTVCRSRTRRTPTPTSPRSTARLSEAAQPDETYERGRRAVALLP